MAFIFRWLWYDFKSLFGQELIEFFISPKFIEKLSLRLLWYDRDVASWFVLSNIRSVESSVVNRFILIPSWLWKIEIILFKFCRFRSVPKRLLWKRVLCKSRSLVFVSVKFDFLPQIFISFFLNLSLLLLLEHEFFVSPFFQQRILLKSAQSSTSLVTVHY